MTGNILKIIACITMLIDHLGIVLFCNRVIDNNIYIIMRSIGRIAFPIFAFLVVEGYRKTKDIRKYQLRLFISALVTQIAYGMFCMKFYKTIGLNVLWLFLLATVLFDLWKTVKTQNQIVIASLITVAVGLIAETININYGFFGMMFMICLFLGRKTILCSAIIVLLFCLINNNWIQAWSLMAIIPLGLYTGQRGSKNKIIQYGFYLIYPLQFLLLAILG